MNTFNDAACAAYEQYLLSDDSVEDALHKMVPGKLIYHHPTCI